MSEPKDVLSFCLSVIHFLGLSSPKKLSKTRKFKLVLFFIVAPFFSSFLAFVGIKTESIHGKMRMFQSSAVFAIITLKSINMVMKFEQIKIFTENLKSVTKKITAQEIVEKSHSQGMKIVKFILVFGFVPAICLHLMSLITRQMFMPTWIPDQLIEYKNSVFFLNWSFYTFCIFYSTVFVVAVDNLLVYSLIQLKGYSEFLSQFFDSSSDEYKGLRRDQTVKFLEDFNDLRRLCS